MKVKNHNNYRLFEYENDLTNPNFNLGDVVINIDRDDSNPIGVVIQLHDDGDCRTDMFGNTSISEVRLATLNEVEQYRKEIVKDLDI